MDCMVAFVERHNGQDIIIIGNQSSK
jgi:hypothetical protein